MSTNKEKLRCAERELGYRKRVYPRLIANDKMSPVHAKFEIEVMEAIAEDYRALVEAEEPELALG